MAGLGPGAVLISRYLLGGEGPEARVSGRVAYTLFRLGLAAAIDRMRADGVELDDEHEATLASLVDVARWHALAQAEGSAAGTSGSANEEAPAIVGDEITVAQAVAVLRTTPRAVRKLAAAGAVPARKVGNVWLLSRAAIEERSAQRCRSTRTS